MTDPVMHRLERARYSLEGLSTGDALGDRFFLHPHTTFTKHTANFNGCRTATMAYGARSSANRLCSGTCSHK